MRLSPINATAFAGREVYYNSAQGESGLKTLSGYYPNSTVEKTLGQDHSYPSYKAYFADPMEFVSQGIRDRVDYIVYDNEPSYPAIEDVKKNYLEHNRTNYREQFEEVRNYFYRREMGGFANVEEAKQEQKKAAECTGFYDRAGDLRYKKETTEDEVKALRAERAELQVGIESTQKELKNQKGLNKSINEHIKNLKIMQKAYGEINDAVAKDIATENALSAAAKERMGLIKAQEAQLKQLENTDYYNNGRTAYPQDTPKYAKYENTSKTYESVQKNMEESFNVGRTKSVVNKQASLLDKTIERFESVLAENKNAITEMQNYIKELQTKFAATDEKIKSRTAFIEECKAKLKPHFEALAKFYKEHGINAIKK